MTRAPSPRDPDLSGAVCQWQLVCAFRQAAELEAHFGEPEPAASFRRHAARLAEAAEVFWDERRGLYADTRARLTFSEHAQAYAALSGLLDASRAERLGDALVGDEALTRATDPFTHFVLEAYGRLGRRERVWPRLQRWFGYDAFGLLTTPEAPEPTRSDCHAWGAHAHFHLFASLLGLRPAAPGFRSVRIAPQWELLRDAAGYFPHPAGRIEFWVSPKDDGVAEEIVLPPGVTGTLARPEGERVLGEGRNAFA